MKLFNVTVTTTTEVVVAAVNTTQARMYAINGRLFDDMVEAYEETGQISATASESKGKYPAKWTSKSCPYSSDRDLNKTIGELE